MTLLIYKYVMFELLKSFFANYRTLRTQKQNAMSRITLSILIVFVTLSFTSASVIPKTRLRQQLDREYCHAIEDFECRCSINRVVCTIDRELPSPINVLENEKQKYQSVELTIAVPDEINVDDHTFEPIKELFKLDGNYSEFRIKFDRLTAPNLSSSGTFNQVFPDNLSQNTQKHLALDIDSIGISTTNHPNVFQNFDADSLEIYSLYPLRGTFQQLFNGSNIKYLRLSGGDIQSDVSQSFTGNIARLEIVKKSSALPVEFAVYPAHEVIINAFYVSEFSNEHPAKYANLVELRVYSGERIPANAFRQFPQLQSLSVNTEEDIDSHAFDDLTSLEKLTLKRSNVTLDVLNGLPNLKELEVNIEKFDEQAQCQLVEKLATGQLAVRDVSYVRQCTCVGAYLDTAVGREPCDPDDCEYSLCEAIANNYNENTRTFNAPPVIRRSDGTNALRERKARVYTAPYQILPEDQEKSQQGASAQLQQPSESDEQISDTDYELNVFEIPLPLHPDNLASSSEEASCSIGKYLYKGQCIRCTPGYYCPDGENRIICRQGTIAPGYGFAACEDCPEGWYSTCDTQESCVMCPKGFACPTNDEEPQPCPVGYYSHYAATECTKCPVGYYTTYTNSTYCFQCPLGYSCADPIECPQPCPAGTYQSDVMSTSCEPCPDDHQCGTTTNLLQCKGLSCVQAEPWVCDPNQLSPPASVCTNMG